MKLVTGLRTASTLVLLAASLGAGASHDVNHVKGVMLEGFDVVAYHTLGEAKKGSPQISADWLGGKWLFISEEHRELFIEDPGSFIPQYGGYCAYSYADGREHGGVDPRSWQIVDGKLYLFYSSRAENRWNVNRPHVKQADRKWEKAKAGLLAQ